eukprot:Rmarinus@m.3407
MTALNRVLVSLCVLLLGYVGFVISIPNPVVPEVTLCFLSRKSSTVYYENVQSFYDSGDNFFTHGLNSQIFSANLEEVDLDAFPNSTEAAVYSIENGCQYIISKASSTDASEIASVSALTFLLSTSCSATSQSLANSRVFPFFVRTLGSVVNEADCLTAFAYTYGLQNVAIVSSDAELSQELYSSLEPKLAKEYIVVRANVLVDGTETSFNEALSTIVAADVMAVVVIGGVTDTDGLFEMARARNLTSNGLIWITSEVYSIHGVTLTQDDPERQGLQYAVGLVPTRGQVTYGNAFASYESYCYDMTEAVLRGIDLAIAQHGFENIDVYNVRRQIDGLVFNGQTGETYFDETGIRESANFSFISFEETSVRYVGKCSGIVYSKTAEVPLPNNETLRVPTTLKLQTNFWKSLPITGPSPSRRTGTLVARSIEHSHIYAFGGAGPNSQAHNDLYLFDVNELAWKQVPTTTDRPRERVSGALVAVRDTLLLYGGITITNNILDDMYWFDIPTATWTEVDLSLMDRPVPRRDFAYVEMQDGFIIFGGYSPYADNPFFNDVWEYKITENVWMLHTPSDFNQVAPLVASPMLAVTNTWDTLFLFGGTTDYNSDEAATYSFDLRTGVWSMVNAESILAPARSGAAIAYYGNSLVVGIGTSHAMSRDLTDFYRLGLDLCDGVTCEGWRKIEMREFSRSGTGNCPVFGGWMYCFGGVVDMDYTNDLNRWRLRSVDNSTHLVSMSDIVVTVSDTSYTIALAKSVISSSNNIFVYGGIEAPGIFSTKLSDYDVNQHDFDQFGSGTAPLRMYHATTSFGGFMVAFGGQNEYGQIVNEMHFIPISATQAPPAYPVEHTEVWPAARSKHVMVTINTEELFMYGGANEIDEHYDSWIFHVTTRMWTLLHEPGSVERTQRVMDFALEQEASFPVHNRGGVAVLVGDFIIYLGGETWSSTPTDNIYAFSFQESSWQSLDATLLKPIVYHVAVAIGTRIIIYGGKHGYNVVDDLYYMQVTSTSANTWPSLGPPEFFTLSSTLVQPTARAYHWGSVVGNTLITGGGMTGSFGYLEGLLLGDVYEYAIGPVCTRDQVSSGDIHSCWLCDVGTYHNTTMSWAADKETGHLYEVSCALCGEGYYTDKAGMLECLPCPTGYMSKEGNVGLSGCYPAARGSKMQIKVSDCEEDEVCPAGSAAALEVGSLEYNYYLNAVSGFSASEQPSGLDNKRDDIEAMKDTIILVCLPLAGCVCAISLMLLTMHKGRWFVTRADRFGRKHRGTTVDGVIQLTKNAFGGFFLFTIHGSHGDGDHAGTNPMDDHE